MSLPPDLNDLSARIAAAKEQSPTLKAEKEQIARMQSAGNMSTGMRAGGELIGGILGGALFGYGFDAMFLTRPYGIVMGAFLGVLAGFYGVYRMTR